MKRIAALDNQVKIAMVSAICLLALVVILKNVIHVSEAALSRDVIIFIVVYSAFWIVPVLEADKDRKSRINPLAWGAAIVTATGAIMAIYAL